MSTLKAVDLQHPSAAAANISLGSTGNVTIPTAGARITGDFSNATVANRIFFQTSTANTFALIGALPSGTGTISGFTAFNNSDPTNASLADLRASSTDVSFRSNISGAGTYLPMTFYTGGSERMRINSSGNVGIGTSSPSVDTTYKWLNIVGPTTSGGGIVQLNNSDSSVGINMFCNNLAGYVGTSTAHPLLFRINSSEVARIDSSGALLIGTTSGSNSPKLFIAANSTNNNAIIIQDTGTAYGTNQWFQAFLNSSGTVAGSIAHTAVTTTAYQTSSDLRLKENIQDSELGLEKVSQIKVRSFDWKEDSSHTDYGFVAQELYGVFPEAVGKGSDGDLTEDGKGTWQVEYGRLTPLLVKAIQELKAQNDELKARVATLEAK